VPQPGPFIQICKQTLGGLTGTFGFTVVPGSSPAAGSLTITSTSGQQCTAPLQLPSGTTSATVTESSGPGQLCGITGANSTSGATANLTGLSASNTAANPRIVVFCNQPVPTQTGTIKVCKAGTVSGEFVFTVSGVASPLRALTGQCSAPVSVPVGTVQVTETLPANVQVTGISVTGGGTGSACAPPASFCVRATISANQETVVTFTNAPGGQLPTPLGPSCPPPTVSGTWPNVVVTVSISAPAGLQSIVPTANTTNANFAGSLTFAPGATSHTFTARPISSATAMRVEVLVTDVLGRSVECDPVFSVIKAGKLGKSKVQTFTITDHENILVLRNNKLGLNRVFVTLNGRVFTYKLRAGQVLRVNFAKFLKRGTNRISLRGVGRRNASAAIQISA
jgi:hypothetical protein